MEVGDLLSSVLGNPIYCEIPHIDVGYDARLYARGGSARLGGGITKRSWHMCLIVLAAVYLVTYAQHKVHQPQERE